MPKNSNSIPGTFVVDSVSAKNVRLGLNDRFKFSNLLAIPLLGVSTIGFSQALLPSQPSPVPAAKSAEELLAQLKPLHLPETVSSIPAPGWWISTVVLIIAAYFLQRFIKASLSKRQLIKATQRYRSQAAELIKELDDKGLGAVQWLVELNQLLKRAALAGHSSSSVASLDGQAWCDFLVSRHRSADAEVFQLLADVPYLPPELAIKKISPSSQDRLRAASLDWLASHQVEANHV